jgi:molecular chaperone DnaK
MNRSDFEQRLHEALRGSPRRVAAFGIDLGTTKSCMAFATYDPASRELQCECLRYEAPLSHDAIGVPSAVAVEQGRVLVGAEALAKRGQRGFLPEKSFFLESKNDIGLRYTYANAPETLRSAEQVATVLLTHLLDYAGPPSIGRVQAPIVVTVPASFHGAQRLATVRAAERAVQHEPDQHVVRLLDEPYAAFLDLLLNAPERAAPLMREGANLMVFDFGGGTCDVAIFRRDTHRGGTLGARLLGTSRYHRLGGGDLDRAIVHDLLLPALYRDNGLESWSASWLEKRRHLEPHLLGVAERLKIALSQKLAQHGANAVTAVELEPLEFQAEVGGVRRTLSLRQPRLDLAGLEQVLRPYLDPEPRLEAGDEYVQRSSIFSPIVQALFRAGLEPRQVDGILLCGSSSLLPPVQAALTKHFPNAALVLRGEQDALQGTVARGAALQALSLQVLGEPLIAPVCSAEIALRVTSGSVVLTRAGDAVPAASTSPVILSPPRDSRDAAVDIAVEAVAEGERLVGRSLWHLPPPVAKDDRLALDWAMDENQCMQLTLRRVGDERCEPFVHRFDAPLMHRDMGQAVRCRMLERCEAIRNGNVPRADLGRAFEQIARDCTVLGEHERALHFVSLALQELGDDVMVLNLRGSAREAVGNREGAKESYRQASEWPGARFNLALMHHRDHQNEAALTAIDSALQDDPTRAYRVLRADILAKLGRTEEARAQWHDAVAGQVDWSKLSDFDLGWLERAASALDQTALRDRIRNERRQLALKAREVTRQGELPAFVSQALHDPAGMV